MPLHLPEVWADITPMAVLVLSSIVDCLLDRLHDLAPNDDLQNRRGSLCGYQAFVALLELRDWCLALVQHGADSPELGSNVGIDLESRVLEAIVKTGRVIGDEKRSLAPDARKPMG